MDLKEKDHLKLSIASLSRQISSQEQHGLRPHFFNLYNSAIKQLLHYFYLLQKTNQQNTDPIVKKSLNIIANHISALEEGYNKLSAGSYFESFGKNIKNKDSLVYLYSNYNAIITIIRNNNYFGIKVDGLLELSEQNFDNKLQNLDDAVKNTNKLIVSNENFLEFNASLKSLQNDLSFVFFIQCLKKTGSWSKRLLKVYEFLQFLARFLQEFEGLDLNEDHILLLQKKLKALEVGNTITANKITLFFNEIWGNLYEKNKIIRIKIGMDKKTSEDYYFPQATNEILNSFKFENQENDLDFKPAASEEKPGSSKKEDCSLF